jgi:hypothetical protein
VLAELLASLVLRAAMEAAAPRTAATAAGLAAWPAGSAAGENAEGALPPPMIPGNANGAASLCALQVSLAAAAAWQQRQLVPLRPVCMVGIAQAAACCASDL